MEAEAGATAEVRPRRRGLRALTVVLVLVLAIGAAGFGAWQWTLGRLDAAGPLASETAVIIPRGASSGTIAERLEQAGVVKDARLFMLGLALDQGPALRAGEFAFPAQASIRQAIGILRSGRTVQRRLTVPEGLTVAQIITVIEQAEGLTGPIETVPAEGTMLPETWAYSWGDTRASVIRRMAEGMERALAEAWAARDPSVPLANPREALILASIIEKETGVAEERGRVAGVFANRLRRGMPLQSDPTVVYAASGGAGELGRPISRADLDADHPMNTYRIRGLPPQPIASPGRASLMAAVRPAETDALYFVADGTGGHVFSRTLEEHNRAVARWRQIERERGLRQN
ncbi:endolytic transglycosylase MltG [Elioraea rosea]|uniref:endolytic transglycosylase MltG n=1 Tax=Elioraea rosea TaxID=2492390 RepID=UPI001183AEB1|nr:endolytic transglycosylase MltG [Elioraea rosea]